MRNRKATGDDDVPGDVLKILGEGGLKILTKLINTLYETGEWPKDFTEVTMIALKKKTKATKCSDHQQQRDRTKSMKGDNHLQLTVAQQFKNYFPSMGSEIILTSAQRSTKFLQSELSKWFLTFRFTDLNYSCLIR